MFEIIYGILKQVWITLLKAKKYINWCQYKTWDLRSWTCALLLLAHKYHAWNIGLPFLFKAQMRSSSRWSLITLWCLGMETVKFENKVRKMSFTSSMLWEFSSSCHLVVIFLPLWGVFSVNCQDARCWTLDLSSCSVIGRKHLKL